MTKDTGERQKQKENHMKSKAQLTFITTHTLNPASLDKQITLTFENDTKIQETETTDKKRKEH